MFVTTFFLILVGEVQTNIFPIIRCASQIDENVKREIINHRSLRHPNIIRFKEVGIFLYFYTFMFSGGIIIFMENFLWNFTQVILTPTHLAIVMEYASGGELFERICNAGRFNEDEVRIQFVYFCYIHHSVRTNLCQLSISCVTIDSLFATGSFLLSTTHIWGQLLSCDGTNLFLPHYLI